MYMVRDCRAPGLSVALIRVLVWFLESGLPVELMLELLDEM